jgi:hypothetical protein
MEGEEGKEGGRRKGEWKKVGRVEEARVGGISKGGLKKEGRVEEERRVEQGRVEE